MGRTAVYQTPRHVADRERKRRDFGTMELQTRRALLAGGEPYIEIMTRVRRDGNVQIVPGAFRPNVRRKGETVVANLDHTTTVVGRLFLAGILTAEQRQASDRLRDLHQRRFGGVTARAANMEPRIPGEDTLSPEAMDRQTRRENAYREAELALKALGWRTLADVLDVVVYDHEPEWRAMTADQLWAHPLKRHHDRLLDGLNALVRHWRLKPREEGGRVAAWQAAAE
jgi:hypothetical protein